MCSVVFNPNYILYNLGEGHPFNPIRLEITKDLLSELGYWKEPVLPNLISPEELYSIHTIDYVNIVEEVSNGINNPDAINYGLGTPDNPIQKDMAIGARYQTGGTLLAAKLILEGKSNKVLQFGGGFHHAHPDFASGFCLYNDIALAIKEFVKHNWHIAYIDIDVHHGDGVQKIFYSDENVMTISLHESGEFLFPGSGWIHELGQGSGRALKLNAPLEPFTEGDSYLEVFNGIVEPALKWFKPDAVFVMAGADAHFSDPLADLMLKVQDYEKIYRRIFEFIDKFAKGRALFTFGGGYSFLATARIWALLYMLLFDLKIPDKLPESWRNKWQKKLNKEIPEFIYDSENSYESISRKSEIEKNNKELIQRILDTVAPYWLI